MMSFLSFSGHVHYVRGTVLGTAQHRPQHVSFEKEISESSLEHCYWQWDPVLFLHRSTL